MNEVKVIEEVHSESLSEIKAKMVSEKSSVKKIPKEKVLLFKREDASKWLPFTLFVFVMVVIYISIQQYAERTVRNTEKIHREIHEMRSEYLSTKAELMKESMQTDIAKKLESRGFKELRDPARKLVMEKPK